MLYDTNVKLFINALTEINVKDSNGVPGLITYGEEEVAGGGTYTGDDIISGCCPDGKNPSLVRKSCNFVADNILKNQFKVFKLLGIY